MKKSLTLFSILIICTFSNKLFAQASATDSSSTNQNVAKTVIAPADDFSVTTGFKIYPNPVRDALQIEGLDPSVKTQISVSSFYGKIIYQSRTSGESTYTANVGKLKPGIYYVTIKEKGKSIMMKFIKE